MADPETQMTTASFASEVERLRWLVCEVEGHTNGRTLDLPPPEQWALFVVTSAWFSTALAQTNAILLLITGNLAEAVGPLQRALWEFWIEWRYLLRRADRSAVAAKVILSAMIEGLEVIEREPTSFGAAYVAKLQANTRQFELRYPVAAAEIRAQRKARKFHWSGLTWTAMERTLARGRSAYGILSWDAHRTVAPLRDVVISRSGSEVSFQFGRDVRYTDVERHAWQSGGVLFYAYNDFAELWGLPKCSLTESGWPAAEVD